MGLSKNEYKVLTEKFPIALEDFIAAKIAASKDSARTEDAIYLDETRERLKLILSIISNFL